MLNGKRQNHCFELDRSFPKSWLSFAEAPIPQVSPQPAKARRDPAVDMKRRRKLHDLRDLLRRELILESVLEKQPVRGIELPQRLVERGMQLPLPQVDLGVAALWLREGGDVLLHTDEIDQSAP